MKIILAIFLLLSSLGCYSQQLKGNTSYRSTDSIYNVWYQKPGLVKVWKQGFYVALYNPSGTRTEVVVDAKHRSKVYYFQSLQWVNFYGSPFSLGRSSKGKATRFQAIGDLSRGTPMIKDKTYRILWLKFLWRKHSIRW